MAHITIEVPDDVYKALKAIAASKGIVFEEFCKSAFAVGLAKSYLGKKVNLK